MFKAVCCPWSGRCPRLATCSLIMTLTCGETIAVVPLQWWGASISKEWGITLQTYDNIALSLGTIPSQGLSESNMDNHERIPPTRMSQATKSVAVIKFATSPPNIGAFIRPFTLGPGLFRGVRQFAIATLQLRSSDLRHGAWWSI